MGDITRKISLYNEAYRLAWAEISKDHRNTRPSVAHSLAKLIHSQIAAGADDAEAIAVEAVRALGLSDR